MYDVLYVPSNLIILPTVTLCARDNRLVPRCPFRHCLGTKRHEHAGWRRVLVVVVVLDSGRTSCLIFLYTPTTI